MPEVYTTVRTHANRIEAGLDVITPIGPMTTQVGAPEGRQDAPGGVSGVKADPQVDLQADAVEGIQGAVELDADALLAEARAVERARRRAVTGKFDDAEPIADRKLAKVMRNRTVNHAIDHLDPELRLSAASVHCLRAMVDLVFADKIRRQGDYLVMRLEASRGIIAVRCRWAKIAEHEVEDVVDPVEKAKQAKLTKSGVNRVAHALKQLEKAGLISRLQARTGWATTIIQLPVAPEHRKPAPKTAPRPVPTPVEQAPKRVDPSPKAPTPVPTPVEPAREPVATCPTALHGDASQGSAHAMTGSAQAMTGSAHALNHSAHALKNVSASPSDSPPDSPPDFTTTTTKARAQSSRPDEHGEPVDGGGGGGVSTSSRGGERGTPGPIVLADSRADGLPELDAVERVRKARRDLLTPPLIRGRRVVGGVQLAAECFEIPAGVRDELAVRRLNPSTIEQEIKRIVGSYVGGMIRNPVGVAIKRLRDMPEDMTPEQESTWTPTVKQSTPTPTPTDMPTPTQSRPMTFWEQAEVQMQAKFAAQQLAKQAMSSTPKAEEPTKAKQVEPARPSRPNPLTVALGRLGSTERHGLREAFDLLVRTGAVGRDSWEEWASEQLDVKTAFSIWKRANAVVAQ